MHAESIDLIDTASADGQFDSPIRFGRGDQELINKNNANNTK